MKLRVFALYIEKEKNYIIRGSFLWGCRLKKFFSLECKELNSVAKIISAIKRIIHEENYPYIPIKLRGKSFIGISTQTNEQYPRIIEFISEPYVHKIHYKISGELFNRTFTILYSDDISYPERTIIENYTSNYSSFLFNSGMSSISCLNEKEFILGLRITPFDKYISTSIELSSDVTTSELSQVFQNFETVPHSCEDCFANKTDASKTDTFTLYFTIRQVKVKVTMIKFVNVFSSNIEDKFIRNYNEINKHFVILARNIIKKNNYFKKKYNSKKIH